MMIRCALCLALPTLLAACAEHPPASPAEPRAMVERVLDEQRFHRAAGAEMSGFEAGKVFERYEKAMAEQAK